MAEQAPVTDWDLIHRWEWNRRSEWLADFRGKGKQKPLLLAFTDLCKLINVNNVLHAGCGLGTDTICLGEMGLNPIGMDSSKEAAGYATKIAGLSQSPVTFFNAPWHALKQTAPHAVDAVLYETLGQVAEWAELQRRLKAIFQMLNPGGFFMFVGAGQNDPEDIVKTQQKEQGEGQDAVWRYKDGATLCVKVVQRTLAADFMDETVLYVINTPEKAQVESTVVRHPAYWTWSHWAQLVREAGFCHLETRTYEQWGGFRVNVAWKSKQATSVDTTGRDQPYLD